VTLVREGRFRGVEVDAMAVARLGEPFFAEADRLQARRVALGTGRGQFATCEQVLRLGLQ
jgi:hypothetical protein